MNSYIYTVNNPFLTVIDLLTLLRHFLSSMTFFVTFRSETSETVNNPFLTSEVYDILGFKCHYFDVRNLFAPRRVHHVAA